MWHNVAKSLDVKKATRNETWGQKAMHWVWVSPFPDPPRVGFCVKAQLDAHCGAGCLKHAEISSRTTRASTAIAAKNRTALGARKTRCGTASQPQLLLLPRCRRRHHDGISDTRSSQGQRVKRQRSFGTSSSLSYCVSMFCLMLRRRYIKRCGSVTLGCLCKSLQGRRLSAARPTCGLAVSCQTLRVICFLLKLPAFFNLWSHLPAT